MHALELATWLRSDSRLPTSTRVTDKNNVFLVVWAMTGKCDIITPLCRCYNDRGAAEDALHIDSPHNFHIVDRALAISFMLQCWTSFHHMGLVPQRPEQISARSASANDQSQLSLLRDAALGKLDAPHVAASVQANAVQCLVSWILDSGSGHDVVDIRHVIASRTK